MAKIDEASGLAWLQTHLDYCASPLLSEPWVLDIDSTIKPLYGDGASVRSDNARVRWTMTDQANAPASDAMAVARLAVLTPGDYDRVRRQEADP